MFIKCRLVQCHTQAGVCKDTEALVRKFSLRGKNNKFICQTNHQRGFGLRRFEKIKEVLLAKLRWVLARDMDSLRLK